MKVAVIGGGPSGLVTLKFLLEAHKYFNIEPIQARLFETEDEIGGTFTQRTYEDAELVSSKYLTAFSDFRFPRAAPDFVTPEQYVQYLNDYATHFDLWNSIECSSRVKRVVRHRQGHRVCVLRKDGGSEEWDCNAIAVCSGLNVTPNVPDIKGMENIPVALHSSQIKTRGQFGRDSNVVILGAGETSMDLAHLAITSSAASVSICHRGGFFCAPKIIPLPVLGGFTSQVQGYSNKPVDTSVASLFDTAYVHPVLQRSPLLWLAYDMWIKKMHWLISGTEEGPDQWVGHMSQDRKHVDSLFMCKSDRALPYISSGHRSNTWWNELRSSIINVSVRRTNGRKIDVLSWPESVDEHGIITVKDDKGNTTQIKPDLVIFATGYKTSFPFLLGNYPKLEDLNVRMIYQTQDVSTGFIGFVRPSLGAIPPLAELQAQLWVFKLLRSTYPSRISRHPDPRALETYEMDWKLHTRAGYDLFTNKRGVDHESYAYQLALDMGAAPSISNVLSRGFKCFFTWAMGPNFNTKFRLVGPWQWAGGAQEIMETELFDVVKRSGGLFYLITYTIIPFIVFGLISAVLFAGSGLSGLLMSLIGALFKPHRPTNRLAWPFQRFRELIANYFRERN